MLDVEQTSDAAFDEAVVENFNAIHPEGPLKARILMADDHFLIAETVSMLLAPHFDVVGVITDGNLISGEVARLRPDVVLLDVTMPEVCGLEAARKILEQAPSTKIIFLTMHANRLILKEALEVGANGFIVKHCAAGDLICAVKTVLNGGTYVSPGVQEGLDSNPSAKLSQRQIAVLRLVSRGCGAKQIAFELNISSRTAEFHKNSIMQKLKIRSTAQLTRYALENGIAS